MNLEGKDLLSITGLHRFVTERLGGFSVELDEMTGEVVIRSGLTIDNDGLFIPLVVQSDDPRLDAPFERDERGIFDDGKPEYRTWFASPNGDWWAADWHEEAPFVYVLREYDIPGDIEGVEEDKFEELIMELGTKITIPT
jgi:hypothetical protein